MLPASKGVNIDPNKLIRIHGSHSLKETENVWPLIVMTQVLFRLEIRSQFHQQLARKIFGFFHTKVLLFSIYSFYL